MKFLQLFILSGLIFFPSHAQYTVQDIIDATVWRPFVTAYNHGDYEAYRAVHSEEVLRITDSGMLTGDGYFDRIKNSFGSRKEDEQTALKLYFDQRFRTETRAYETGFYHVTFTRADGNTDTYAGRFHVVLEKKDSTWRIIQDYDTGNILGQPVAEMDFTHLPVVEE